MIELETAFSHRGVTVTTVLLAFSGLLYCLAVVSRNRQRMI